MSHLYYNCKKLQNGKYIEYKRLPLFLWKKYFIPSKNIKRKKESKYLIIKKKRNNYLYFKRLEKFNRPFNRY